MRLRKILNFSLILFFLFLFFNISINAQNSSIFFNVGGILQGVINFGYSYYFSSNFALRGSINIISVSESGYTASVFMFGVGIHFFFEEYSGFFIAGDIGFGNLTIEGYTFSANLFKFFGGYRFLFNNFFIDPGLGFGVVSLAGSSLSKGGLYLEIGFLF